MSGEVVLYRTQDGKAQVQFRSMDGTFWLSQGEIAELFDTTKQNVGMHAKNIIEEGELPEESGVKESFTTAADGKKYRVKVYCQRPRSSGVYCPRSRSLTGQETGYRASSTASAHSSSFCRSSSLLGR